MLRKTTDLSERFLLQEMWKKMESFIDSLLKDTKDELLTAAKQLAEEMVSVANSLQQTIQEQSKSAVDSIEKVANKNTVSMTETQSKIISDVTTRAEAAIARAEVQAQTILARLEQMRGPQGEQGEKGEDGKDGSPDTGDQIVAKINNAKGKISVSAIAGLSKALERIARNAKSSGGGGGMGNVVHQSTAVSSATTSVSLQHRVAGSSAIWIAYQGQTLALGTHYTVSGKDIDLLFTPDDSTALDITYIRA